MQFVFVQINSEYHVKTSHLFQLSKNKIIEYKVLKLRKVNSIN